MNYCFVLDDWLPRFPLTERNGHFQAQIVTSPWDLCQNEHLRRELHDAYAWGPAVPVDIFIMADGEPPDRHVTKIGGLPYRPRLWNGRHGPMATRWCFSRSSVSVIRWTLSANCPATFSWFSQTRGSRRRSPPRFSPKGQSGPGHVANKDGTWPRVFVT